METKTIDLYQYFHKPRQGAEAGTLTSLCWQPKEGIGPGRRSPAVLILPGGGYAFTSEREAEPVALRFAAKGYQAFILYYSCAPSRFPAALREAAMAMAYIRQNADAFAIDPGMVAAVGFSAGGHLCGTLGTLYNCPEVADIAPAEEIRPNALGLCYPVTISRQPTHEQSFRLLCGEDQALRERLSLDRLVRGDMPPVYLWHTLNDETVPVRGTLLLAQALEEAGVTFALRIYPQGSHGLSTADDLTYPVGRVPRISREIPQWPDDMAHFFEDCGFAFREAPGEA